MEKKKKPYKKVDHIEVYIWNHFVGAAALDPKLGFYVFAYNKKFGKTGIELSPLHMPLNDQETLFVFTDLPTLTYKRLPALLVDSLPDDFGNALIDRYMADKGIDSSEITALDRLAYMGNRSMGALEFQPARGPKAENPTMIEMKELVQQARQMVSGRFDGDEKSKKALRNIIEVGTSAGGARAKAVIAWNRQTNEIKSGQVPAEDGFEQWLLKFDGMGVDGELGTSQDYGRIEYAYYLMAKAAGISMSESRLLEENGRAHFMTKRFDRDPGNKKHHMLTLCAMNHFDYKKQSTNSYEQFFITIRKLNLGHDAEVEAFRRVVINIMGKNCDDHTKNFSFLLKQGESWSLTPFYDFTFAHNPNGEWTHQHLMSVNGKFSNFTLKDLLTLSDRFKIGEAKDIIKQSRVAIKRWPEFAQQAKVNSRETDKIKKQHLLFE